jgi:tetratricopeptide (TPR) repeat protein
VTAKTRRLLEILVGSSVLGLVAVAIMTYVTWPTNTLGNYIRDRQNREANIRTITWRIERESDPLQRRFYQAMLAEEKGDLDGAIRGFKSLRDDLQPGTKLHLTSALRLGLAYGQNRQPEQQLATYQALMDRYPGQSRLSQAVFHLRRGERERARVLLDEALAQDEKDGSLGAERQFALSLRSGLGPKNREATSSPH